MSYASGKYAPAIGEMKPYVRICSEWGREHSTIVYAYSVTGAKNAYRRMRYETVSARRATVEDLERIDMDTDSLAAANATVACSEDPGGRGKP